MTVDLTIARAVAALMDPPRAPQAVQIEGMESALIEACISNKVPLLSLEASYPTDAPWAQSVPFHSARDAEAASWQAQRREYLPVQEALNSEGIPHTLIKSVGLAPSLPYRSDNLDLLVSQEDASRVREILLDLGYIELLNVEEPHKFLFRKFALRRGAECVGAEGTKQAAPVVESTSAIHLHEFVGWGTEFLAAEAVLQGTRLSPEDPVVRIPSPEHGLLITMAHAFYEDKAIKLGDLWKVFYLLRRHDLDWDGMRRLVEARGWRAGLDTCIVLWSSLEAALYGEHSVPAEVVAQARVELPAWCRNYINASLGAGENAAAQAPAFPSPVSFAFSKRHYYAKVLSDSQLSRGQKAVDIVKHSTAGIERRLPLSVQRRFQRPMLIALSGIDGCGKTTQAECLRQALTICDIDARLVWSRGGSSPFTDAVIRLVRRVALDHSAPKELDVESDTREAKVARKQHWLRHPLLRLGWLGLVGTDLVLRYGAQIGWPLLNRWVVIADRYLFDALVELAALADSAHLLDSRAARLLRRLCPKPQAAYLLDIPPERALERAPDETLAFLEQQAFLYRNWALAWDVQMVNAEDDLAEVTETLLHQTLQAYYGRWRRGEALRPAPRVATE